jgi:methionine-rich copper-binding protein CopC
MNRLQLSALAFAAIAATSVSAHPKLLSATPAANATVASPAHIELHFSEKLIPQMTGSDLVKGSAKVASTTTVGADGKTMIVQPKTPLTAGSYSLNWHAVSVDTHRVTGIHKFSVR